MGSCQGSCFVNDKATSKTAGEIEGVLDQESKKKGTSKKQNKKQYVEVVNKNEEEDQRGNGRKDKEEEEEKNENGDKKLNDAQAANNGHQGFGPVSQPIKTMNPIKGAPNTAAGNQLVEETIGLPNRKELPEIQLENGAFYKGEWKNGVRDGVGTQEWPDGSKYEGGTTLILFGWIMAAGAWV